jgi:hypothetical protein
MCAQQLIPKQLTVGLLAACVRFSGSEGGSGSCHAAVIREAFRAGGLAAEGWHWLAVVDKGAALHILF